MVRDNIELYNELSRITYKYGINMSDEDFHIMLDAMLFIDSHSWHPVDKVIPYDCLYTWEDYSEYTKKNNGGEPKHIVNTKYGLDPGVTDKKIVAWMPKPHPYKGE